ncbi:MAG: Ribonuclease protein component [Candidatus Berkelbacteria bacterium]|nr:Ribonuclease protein component [Candidatus Berkelbacteria bacterium]
MLAKKYRLSRKDIGIIHKRGKKFNAGAIGIKYFTNNLSFARFAINIPKSVYKKATDRNRLRRIIYDEVGKKQITPYDIIISIYHQVDEKNIKAQIQESFDRLRL